MVELGLLVIFFVCRIEGLVNQTNGSFAVVVL